jgi:hypothetical protein
MARFGFNTYIVDYGLVQNCTHDRQIAEIKEG